MLQRPRQFPQPAERRFRRRAEPEPRRPALVQELLQRARGATGNGHLFLQRQAELFEQRQALGAEPGERIDECGQDVVARRREGETADRVKTKSRGLARVSGGKGTASRTVGLLNRIAAPAP